MNQNLKFYFEMIEKIEKKRNDLQKSILKKKKFSDPKEKEILEKYDDLLLEQYKKIEKMVER